MATYSFDSDREAIVVRMMMRPILKKGLGISSATEAEKTIGQRVAEVSLMLIESEVSPDQVSDETLELLVWENILVSCGMSAIGVPPIPTIHWS